MKRSIPDPTGCADTIFYLRHNEREAWMSTCEKCGQEFVMRTIIFAGEVAFDVESIVGFFEAIDRHATEHKK